MKKVLTRILSGVVLCALLTTGAAAATLQSGQAAYQLSLDPLGTEPFSYSDTETYSATLVPIGTRVSSETGALLLVEIFTYSESSGHWALNSLLSGQSDLVVRDSAHLYHISTLVNGGENSDTVDRGIWLKAPSQGSSQPISVTGEPVDEWALNLVNQAIAGGLMPDHLKGQDLREPITRLQFAALTVRLYETASGQSIQVPGENPFTDTSDPEALKAYSMGFTAGTSASTFGPEGLLTREQAAVMLTAVYRALGGSSRRHPLLLGRRGDLLLGPEQRGLYGPERHCGRLRRRPLRPPGHRPAAGLPHHGPAHPPESDRITERGCPLPCRPGTGDPAPPFSALRFRPASHPGRAFL